MVSLNNVANDEVFKYKENHYCVDHSYSGGGWVGVINMETHASNTLIGTTPVEVVCKKDEWAVSVEPVEPKEVKEPTFAVTEATVWENELELDSDDPIVETTPHSITLAGGDNFIERDDNERNDADSGDAESDTEE